MGSAQPEWEFVKGFWANMRYVRLDADLDGVVDDYTNQYPGARPGKNNTYVVRMMEEDGERKARTYLWFEGHGEWPANGPLGQFSEDSRSIEIRVPYSHDEDKANRRALHMPGARFGFQGHMSYRDQTQGSDKWASEHYPATQDWLLYSSMVE